MIYLVLSILTNALFGIIFKVFGQKEVNTFFAIFLNYFICVAMAFLVLGEWPIPKENFSAPWTMLAIGLGFLFPLIFNLYAIAVKHLGIVVSTIFQKMSLIAPVILGILFYSEVSSWLKIAGVLFAILAIFLIPKEEANTENRVERKYLLFGLLVFIGSAFIDMGLLVMEKSYGLAGSDIKFLATLFLFAGIGAFPLLLINLFKHKATIQSKDVIAGIVLGVPNFFSIYFILKGLSSNLDGSIFFPINNVGILLVSAIAGIMFFHEKMNKYKYLGFLFSIIAIVLLSI